MKRWLACCVESLLLRLGDNRGSQNQRGRRWKTRQLCVCGRASKLLCWGKRYVCVYASGGDSFFFLLLLLLSYVNSVGKQLLSSYFDTTCLVGIFVSDAML